MLLVAVMRLHGRKAPPLRSVQWPEKSLVSSGQSSRSWTYYINHTFRIKIGISNPGRETAIWLRSCITFVHSKCETPHGSFNIWQRWFPAIKRTWLFYFVVEALNCYPGTWDSRLPTQNGRRLPMWLRQAISSLFHFPIRKMVEIRPA